MNDFAAPKEKDGQEGREEDLWLYEQLLETTAVAGVSRGPWERVHSDPTWRHSIACLETLARVWPRPAVPQPSAAPEKIGRFAIEDELGRGASGIVYRARDPLLGRTVALKVPRLATLHVPELRRRFFQEARAAAALKHPHLVSVFEAGESGSFCFLVAEYCAGPSLARWLRERTILVPARVAAEWIADLAEAVQHAHEKGILHRDIKPGNILLEPLPASSSGTTDEFAFRVKLTDFGLAKLVDGEPAETLSGAILGTPAYMSPEQAAGQARSIGPPADVYSLGAVLYELLTGGPPFRGDSDLDLLRQVSQVEPVPPRRLHGSVPRNLETICLKCLTKTAGRRYSTPGELAQDLRRFLAGEPIAARPASWAAQLLKWVRRHWVASAGVVVAAVVLSAGLAGVLWHTTAIARKDADLRVAAIRESSQQEQLTQRQRQVEAQQLATSLRLVQRFVEDQKLPQAVVLLEEHRPRDQQDSNFAWNYWWNLLCRGEIVPLTGHSQPIGDLAWSGNGRLFAGLAQGSVAIWDGTQARCAKSFPALPDAVRELEPSGDERWLAVTSNSHVACIDQTSFRRVWMRSFASSFHSCAFSPDGQRLYIAADSPVVQVVSPATGKVLDQIRLPGDVDVIEFPKQAQRPIFGGRDGVYVWSKSAQAWRCHPTHIRLAFLAANETGTRISAMTVSDQLVVLDDELGKVWQRPFHPGVFALEWVAGSDQLFVLHDRDEPRSSFVRSQDGAVLEIHDDAADVAAVSPPASVMALARGRELWIRPLGPRKSSPEPAHDREAWSVAFHPTGRLLATGSDDETARVWDLTTRKCLHVLTGHKATVSSVAFSPRGDELLTASLDGEAKVWNWREERCLHTLKGHSDRIRKAVYAPDGRWIATGGYDSTVRIYDAASGREVRVLRGHLRRVRGVHFSKDGKVLVTACEGGQILVWNTGTWKTEEILSDTDQVWSLAISPDGETIAAGNSGGMLSLRSRGSGRKPVLLHGHASGIRALAYSPDGRVLASGDVDAQIRLWDPLTGHELSVLRRHTSELHALAFSPGGDWLASADHSGAIHLWDGRPGGNVFRSSTDAQRLTKPNHDNGETKLASPQSVSDAQMLANRQAEAGLLKDLAATHPRHRAGVAATLDAIGEIQTGLGQFEPAKESLHETLRIREELHAEDLQNVKHRSSLGLTRARLAALSFRSGQAAQALSDWDGVFSLVGGEPAWTPGDSQLADWHLQRGRARWLSSAGDAQLLALFDSGEIVSTERWQAVTDSRRAPSGTRLVRIRLLSMRYSAFTNESYFDALSFRVPAGPNLLVNASAEEPTANGEIPGWKGSGRWRRCHREPPHPIQPQDGRAFYHPGPGHGSLTEMFQDIDVSEHAAAIDGGNQEFQFEGYVRSFDKQPADSARIIVEYRTGAGWAAPEVLVADYEKSLALLPKGDVLTEFLAWLTLDDRDGVSAQTALALLDRLAEYHGDDPKSLFELSAGYVALGQLWWESDRHPDAHRIWQECLTRLELLRSQHPADAELGRRMGEIEFEICDNYGRAGAFSLVANYARRNLRLRRVGSPTGDPGTGTALAIFEGDDALRDICRMLDEQPAPDLFHLAANSNYVTSPAYPPEKSLKLIEQIVVGGRSWERYLLALAQHRAGKSAEGRRTLDTVTNYYYSTPDSGALGVHFVDALLAHSTGPEKLARERLQEAEAYFVDFCNQTLQMSRAGLASPLSENGHWGEFTGPFLLRREAWRLIGKGTVADEGWLHLIEARAAHLLGETSMRDEHLAAADRGDDDVRLARARLLKLWNEPGSSAEADRSKLHRPPTRGH